MADFPFDPIGALKKDVHHIETVFVESLDTVRVRMPFRIPKVRCMICNLNFDPAEALTHVINTGHNNWELILVRAK